MTDVAIGGGFARGRTMPDDEVDTSCGGGCAAENVSNPRLDDFISSGAVACRLIVFVPVEFELDDDVAARIEYVLAALVEVRFASEGTARTRSGRLAGVQYASSSVSIIVRLAEATFER